MGEEKTAGGRREEIHHQITSDSIAEYRQHLAEDEKSHYTVLKYMHDINQFFEFLPEEKKICKWQVLGWKRHLEKNYAVSSANSMLVALNRFLQYQGWNECCVKLLKCQRKTYCEERRELSRSEYERLVAAARAKGNRRLALVIETICSTGIRVSELRYITAEAARCGRAEIRCKGKHRVIFLPKKLCTLLNSYAGEKKIFSGILFRTRGGKALDRSNIWHDMKNLCKDADVEPSKVFPHNLRHLFARTFYRIDKDIAKLADILGHSSIETTRIYMMSTGAEHARQIARLGLVI